MTAWPEGYPYPVLVEEMQRAHDVVGGLDLVIDVLDACAIGREKRDRMVHLVNAKQGGVADAVADARVAHLRPEDLIANRVLVHRPI